MLSIWRKKNYKDIVIRKFRNKCWKQMSKSSNLRSLQNPLRYLALVVLPNPRPFNRVTVVEVTIEPVSLVAIIIATFRHSTVRSQFWLKDLLFSRERIWTSVFRVQRREVHWIDRPHWPCADERRQEKYKTSALTVIVQSLSGSSPL